MPVTRLLLISRDAILEAMEGKSGEKVLRLLTTLTRLGLHLLVTAPQPTKWTGEHGNPDADLLGPNSIRKRLASTGGTLDGVYYVRRSMLTQKRVREEALQDILNRYSVPAGETVLLSSSRNFVKAALELGLRATFLNNRNELVLELGKLVDRQLATDD